MKTTYKMIRVYNIKSKGNTVTSADYDLIAEMDDFELDDIHRDKLIKICKEKNLPSGQYTIVAYFEGTPVAIPGILFYHTDEDIEEDKKNENQEYYLESFLDVAEHDLRVYATVALKVPDYDCLP